MDQSLEVSNIKNEIIDSTWTDRLEIKTEMQMESVKQESDSLVHTDFYVKTEPLEDETVFSVIADTSYKMCPIDDIKYEIDEPMIKIESEDLVDEIMKDPIDVGIKGEEYCPTNFDDELRNKIEEMKKENDNKFLQSDEDLNLCRGEYNRQNELLIKNEVCKSKKYICVVCNSSFIVKSDLNMHLRMHTGQTLFTCGICKKSFNTMGNLDTHMLTHSGDKPYVCNVCEETFSQESALNRHRLKHGEMKLLSCRECKKSFARKQDFAKHKLVHTGEKPFACDLCDKAFTSTSNLIRHRRLHTGEKPYACDRCNKTFAEISTLKRHKSTHRN